MSLLVHFQREICSQGRSRAMAVTLDVHFHASKGHCLIMDRSQAAWAAPGEGNSEKVVVVSTLQSLNLYRTLYKNGWNNEITKPNTHGHISNKLESSCLTRPRWQVGRDTSILTEEKTTEKCLGDSEGNSPWEQTASLEVVMLLKHELNHEICSGSGKYHSTRRIEEVSGRRANRVRANRRLYVLSI